MGRKDEIYRCEVCGQEVRVIKDGPGRLYCCGKPMTPLNEKPASATA